jgi:hypothetical protein
MREGGQPRIESEEELLQVKKSCCKVKCDAVRRTLGSEEDGLVGQEDTKRGSERRHAKGSRCRSTFHAATASLVGGERSFWLDLKLK